MCGDGVGRTPVQALRQGQRSGLVRCTPWLPTSQSGSRGAQRKHPVLCASVFTGDPHGHRSSPRVVRRPALHRSPRAGGSPAGGGPCTRVPTPGLCLQNATGQLESQLLKQQGHRPWECPFNAGRIPVSPGMSGIPAGPCSAHCREGESEAPLPYRGGRVGCSKGERCCLLPSHRALRGRLAGISRPRFPPFSKRDKISHRRWA